MTFAEFGYLIVGACLALAAQLVVQLIVIPRVDLRKRREDRWERHVLELGELLTTEIDQLAGKARRSQMLAVHLRNEARAHPEKYPHGIESHIKELESDAKEDLRAFDNVLTGRFTWLVERVSDPDSQHPEIMKLWLTWARYRLCGVNASSLDYADASPTTDEVDDIWTVERKFHKEVYDHISKLARSGPPRGPSMPARLKRSIHRSWSVVVAIWKGENARSRSS